MATSLPPAKRELYRFGPYEVDLVGIELRKFGVRVPLERKPWQLLASLIQRPGELVARSELQRELWPEGTHVDFEQGLNVAINKLRYTLCDSAGDSKYIETVSRFGYRFVANVERVPLGINPSPSDAATLPDSTAVEPIRHAEGGRWWKQVLLVAALTTIGFLALVIANPVIHSKGQNAARTQKTMMVVLPFQNLSNDPSQDYFSDGITEELSAQLGNIAPLQLGVIGRTSAMAYKHSNKTINQIGQELAVAYVLEGSVRRDGDMVRVTAQLVQVADQAHVWAQSYDRDTRGLLQVEDQIASDIARHVEVSVALVRPEKTLPLHIPSSEAHEAYLLGRYYFYKRTPEGWKSGERYFRRAIEKDPQYAAAYAGLAQCRFPREDALAAARKAVDLDPAAAETQTALGWVELYRYWDFAAAAEALQTAIQLDPNFAPAHHTYAAVLGFSGRLAEAIDEEKKAVTLDPLALIFRASLAAELFLAHEDDLGKAEINRVLAIDPRYPKAYETLGDFYISRGMYKEGIREYEASHLYGGDKNVAGLGYAHARSGDRNEALRILSELKNQEKRSPSRGPSFDLALVEIGLGNRDAALVWLKRAYQQYDDDGPLALKVDPIFDPLRHDPRFQELLRRMNFPQ